MPPSTAPGFTSDSYASSTTGGATGNTASSMGNINDTVTMPAGSTITYIVTANINPASVGTLSNTATVTPPSGVSGMSSSSTVSNPLTPSADLAVMKSAASTVSAGTNLTYTITVTNNGPSYAVNVMLTDPLPANTTFVSFVAPIGWTPSTPAVGNPGTVSFTDPSVATGTYQFMIVVHVSNTLTYGTVLTNKASVKSTTPDSTPGNNSSTANTTVLTPTIGSLQVTQNIPKQTPAVLTGTIINPIPGDALVLTVNWGDGTIVMYPLAAGATSFSETHLLKPGSYAISASLQDSVTGSNSPVKTVTTTVINVPPTVNPISGPTSGSVGQALTWTGSFTDLDPISTMQVSWSIIQDVSPNPPVYNVPFHAATDAGALSITFTFSKPGTYTVSFSVKDQYGLVKTVQLPVTITA
jgi:uncharacterized repeat protein (TIGR01451 family)